MVFIQSGHKQMDHVFRVNILDLIKDLKKIRIFHYYILS